MVIFSATKCLCVSLNQFMLCENNLWCGRYAELVSVRITQCFRTPVEPRKLPNLTLMKLMMID
ncbi:hypothetical protein PM082_024469 [Marasmius tenuissimus]|nr:hypothetical protein PM082_024469 [Marasmius tenuissimus]